MILVEWIGWLCLKNTCSPMPCVCMLDMTFVLRCRSSIGRIDGLKSQAILLPAANGQLNHLRFCVITLQKLQNQYANQAKAINTPYINSRYHSIHNSVNTFFFGCQANTKSEFFEYRSHPKPNRPVRTAHFHSICIHVWGFWSLFIVQMYSVFCIILFWSYRCLQWNEL